MKDLNELRDNLQGQRPVPWEQLPDFALYIDQVLSYMERQVLRFDGDDGLTAAMVNNYTKSGLAPRAEGKKYSREHLAYFTVICILKRVMSTRDMDLLIREELKGERTVPESYKAFCESLDKAMKITAGELDGREGRTLADDAIHFALLSYAAGVASSHCVAMLRKQRGQEIRASRKAQESKAARKGKERG